MMKASNCFLLMKKVMKQILLCMISVLMLFSPYVCWGYNEKVLSPSKPLQAQLMREYDTYIVKDRFDLRGQALSLPKNATLEFKDGGAFHNGTVIFNNTKLEGRPSILCKVAGTIVNKELYVDWFIREDNLDFLKTAEFFSIASGHEIIFSNQTYLVSKLMLDNRYSIQLKDARLIGNNATVKVVNNDEVLGSMFALIGCENLTMEDFIIDGSIARDVKTLEGGRHNLSIKDSRNIELKNIRSINALTDGFYIIRGKDITLDGCIADYNGRQGCSIIAGTNIVIKNSTFSHSCRNAPMMGIDIEPNDSFATELSIVIDSCRFIDNISSGIGINIGNKVQKNKIGKDKNIKVTNCTFSGNRYHISCSAGENTGQGRIMVSECTMENARFCSINIKAYSAVNTPHLVIQDTKIHNSNLAGGKDYREHKSVIAVHNVSSKPVRSAIGNIELSDIEITQDKEYKDNIDRGILFYSNDSRGGYKNVSLGEIRVDLGKPETRSVKKIHSSAVKASELRNIKKAKQW